MACWQCYGCEYGSKAELNRRQSLTSARGQPVLFEGLTARLLRLTAGLSVSVHDALPALSCSRLSIQAKERPPDVAGIPINMNSDSAPKRSDER